MNEHWQKILNRIEEEYGIKEHQDWFLEDRSKLKRLQRTLELRVKAAIIRNAIIAKEFMPQKLIYDFIELPKDRKESILENCLINNKMGKKIKIDDRTLADIFSTRNKPYHARIRNIFAIYVYDMLFDYSFSLIEQDRVDSMETGLGENNFDTQSRILAQFYGTHWWVYYFDETNHANSIGRAVLTIQNKNQVTLTNEETETSTHYLGHIALEYSSQHICLDLTTQGMRGKHLRITLFIGLGRVYPLLLGVYTNIRGDNAMVAGSIILEKVEDISIIQQMQPSSFSPTSAKAAGIDEAIIAFLKDRNKNNLRIPSGIFTKKKLSTWKKNQTLRNQNKTDT